MREQLTEVSVNLVNGFAATATRTEIAGLRDEMRKGLTRSRTC
jgi:hypothetical protein